MRTVCRRISREKAVVTDFSLPKGAGAYCVFTDASLVGQPSKPGDYKVMGSGQVQPGDNMLGVVSLFADDANGSEFKTMVKIINSLTLKPTVVREDALQIKEGKDQFTLNVPVSHVTMIIPKNGFVAAANSIGGSTDSSRYFSFLDQKSGLMISGWFESQSSFSSSRKVWERDTKEWELAGMPAPTNVSFQKIEDWDAVLYDTPLKKISNTHIRAHWVKAGTWIDLHLSLTSSRPIEECREQVMTLLKSIQVQEKK